MDTSADVRAAVLLDPAGGLVAASGAGPGRARRFADLAHQLVAAADSASGAATEQIEAQLEGAAVFAVRDTRYILACVARKLAMPALVLYDLRQALLAIEEGA